MNKHVTIPGETDSKAFRKGRISIHVFKRACEESLEVAVSIGYCRYRSRVDESAAITPRLHKSTSLEDTEVIANRLARNMQRLLQLHGTHLPAAKQLQHAQSRVGGECPNEVDDVFHSSALLREHSSRRTLTYTSYCRLSGSSILHTAGTANQAPDKLPSTVRQNHNWIVSPVRTHSQSTTTQCRHGIVTAQHVHRHAGYSGELLPNTAAAVASFVPRYIITRAQGQRCKQPRRQPLLRATKAWAHHAPCTQWSRRTLSSRYLRPSSRRSKQPPMPLRTIR